VSQKTGESMKKILEEVGEKERTIPTMRVIADSGPEGWRVTINTSSCLPLSPAELKQLQLAIQHAWRESYLRYQHRQVVERQKQSEVRPQSENKEQTTEEVTNGK
jgi:hypothetical protein